MLNHAFPDSSSETRDIIRMRMPGVLVLFLTMVSFLLSQSPTVLSKYQEWEKPIPYCAVAEIKCVSYRNDDAFMPYQNTTRCYCDKFCFRAFDDHDCCPDYEEVCENGGAQERYEQPDIHHHHSPLQPQPSTQEPHVDEANRMCAYEGVDHHVGSSRYMDCNECVCEHGDPYLQQHAYWVCEQDVCANDRNLIRDINGDPYKTTWTASAYDRWSNQKIEDIKRYSLGTILERADKDRLSVYTTRDSGMTYYMFAPDQSWDARHHGWTINAVRDQGRCGVSWALSAVDVVADRIKKTDKSFSLQYVLDCSDVKAKNGCKGGYVDHIWGFLRTNGVISESIYPYVSGATGAIGDCRYRVSKSDEQAANEIGLQYMKPAYKVDTYAKQVKFELVMRGPIQATMLVCPDFYQYRGGVYKRTWTGDMSLCDYHSIRLIGWGTEHMKDDSYMDYWICINSWGEEWGEDGYFRIKQEDSEINEYLIATWV